MATEVIKLDGKQLDASSIYMKSVFDKVYPVGAIYMSVSSTSPATLFGGTWTQLQNRFLVGAGGSYSVNAIGGSTSHTHSLGNNGYALIGNHSSDLTFCDGGVTPLFKDVTRGLTAYTYSHNADSVFNSSSTRWSLVRPVTLGGATESTSLTPPTSLYICGNVLRKNRRCLWQK